MIVQGDRDTIVAPEVTARLADRPCAQGETVDFRVLPGIGHLQTGQVEVPDVLHWIADRFVGKPGPTTCR